MSLPPVAAQGVPLAFALDCYTFGGVCGFSHGLVLPIWMVMCPRRLRQQTRGRGRFLLRGTDVRIVGVFSCPGCGRLSPVWADLNNSVCGRCWVSSEAEPAEDPAEGESDGEDDGAHVGHRPRLRKRLCQRSRSMRALT